MGKARLQRCQGSSGVFVWSNGRRLQFYRESRCQGVYEVGAVIRNSQRRPRLNVFEERDFLPFPLPRRLLRR